MQRRGSGPGPAQPGSAGGHPGSLRKAGGAGRLCAADRDDPDARRRQALHGDRDTEGRAGRPDRAHPHAVRCPQGGRRQRFAVDDRGAAPGRRGAGSGRLHTRVSGRSREVSLAGCLRDDPAAARPAERVGDRRHHRRLGHHRLAGQARSAEQRPRRHDRVVVRRLDRGDGAAASASGAEGRGAGEPDGRWLDGRRLVPLRRLPGAELRLHRRADRTEGRRRRRAARAVRRLHHLPRSRRRRRLCERGRPRPARLVAQAAGAPGLRQLLAGPGAGQAGGAASVGRAHDVGTGHVGPGGHVGRQPLLRGAQAGRSRGQQLAGHRTMVPQPGRRRRALAGAAALARRHRAAVPARHGAAVLPRTPAGRAACEPATGELLRARPEPLAVIPGLAGGTGQHAALPARRVCALVRQASRRRLGQLTCRIPPGRCRSSRGRPVSTTARRGGPGWCTTSASSMAVRTC